MTPKEKLKVKSSFIRACKANDTYIKEGDDLLIDQLVFNILNAVVGVAFRQERGLTNNRLKTPILLLRKCNVTWPSATAE